ncbi:MAG: NUDIX hydrolase [Lentisphaeraceae bacterium]|nr:NUDIX hydrolase [Lentisphaeraceae bacterium]
MNKWKVKSTRKIFSSHIVELEGRMSVNPRNGIEDEYYIATFPDWCNVIALTPEKEIVLIRHFRHGSRTFEVEFPGGCIDEGEKPLDAAVRELKEETGYVGKNPVLISNISPNPSFQTNRCYTVFIENAKKVTEQSLDEGEDIEIFKVPLEKVPELIQEGSIGNSMIIAAFYLFELYQRKT